MKKHNRKKRAGTKPAPAAGGTGKTDWDALRRKRLIAVSDQVKTLAKGGDLCAEDRQRLACDLANLIREKLGCFATVWVPADVTSAGEDLADLTLDECEEALSLVENYDHIYSSICEAIADAARQVRANREEGAR